MTGDWRTAVLDRIEPSAREHDEITAAASSLAQAIQARLDDAGWAGEPRVEGSLAKGTYLKGQTDADIFVAFPPELDREALTQRITALGDLLDDPVMAYAEHPYVQGTWEHLPAEIVPCYALEDPRNLASAVDRTPFHTDYILERITDEQRREVRLLKAWLTATGTYGAEEAVLGVSGYLAELLVLAHGSFEAVLTWATGGMAHAVTLTEPPAATFEDTLVVVDPVDPTRNVAAAVARATCEQIREAAAAFLADPSPRFFEPPPPPEMPVERAKQRVTARASRLLVLDLPIQGEPLVDPVHAQVRRAAVLATEALERAQVPVTGVTVHLETEGRPKAPVHGWVAVETQARALETPLHHQGPPASAGDHAERFRERWTQAKDAAGPVREEAGRLVVARRREATTLARIVAPLLAKANAGKVVDRALDEGSLGLTEGAQAIEHMPARLRGELLDRRRPWERV